MMDSENMKFVEYDKYCPTCKNKKVKDEEGEDPCNYCLTEPAIAYSHKPVKYEKED